MGHMIDGAFWYCGKLIYAMSTSERDDKLRKLREKEKEMTYDRDHMGVHPDKEMNQRPITGWQPTEATILRDVLSQLKDDREALKLELEMADYIIDKLERLPAGKDKEISYDDVLKKFNESLKEMSEGMLKLVKDLVKPVEK